MNRVKKSEMKKKHRIRETIIGLSLAIGIGLGGSIGSYAYFSDKVNTDNGIKITMGSLGIKIEYGLNIDNLQLDDAVTKTFTIKNEGTLDQKIKLINEFKDSQYDDYIEYNLEIKTSNNEDVLHIDDQGKLLSSDKNNRFILAAGDYLNCTSKINIKKNLTIEQKKQLSEKEIEFKLKVLASQINFEDDIQKGFTDVAIQENYIKIGKLPNLDVKMHQDEKVIMIFTPEEYKEFENFSVESIKGTGAFQTVKVNKTNYPNQMFYFTSSNAWFANIPDDFNDNDQVRLTIIFKNKNSVCRKKEEWNIQFRLRNGKLEARYDVLKTEPCKLPNTQIESLDE